MQKTKNRLSWDNSFSSFSLDSRVKRVFVGLMIYDWRIDDWWFMIEGMKEWWLKNLWLMILSLTGWVLFNNLQSTIENLERNAVTKRFITIFKIRGWFFLYNHLIFCQPELFSSNRGYTKWKFSKLHLFITVLVGISIYVWKIKNFASFSRIFIWQHFFYIVIKLFKEFIMEVTANINLRIDDLARVIAKLSKEELKILEARLSKEDNILKGRLNDVKNKKVKLLSREQVFSNL